MQRTSSVLHSATVSEDIACFLTSKDHTLFNGAFCVLARVIKNVMASAMEAEIAAMYENAKKIIKL